jgi:hypothetical protein
MYTHINDKQDKVTMGQMVKRGTQGTERLVLPERPVKTSYTKTVLQVQVRDEDMKVKGHSKGEFNKTKVKCISYLWRASNPDSNR